MSPLRSELDPSAPTSDADLAVLPLEAADALSLVSPNGQCHDGAAPDGGPAHASALSGTVWTVFGFGATQILRFVFNLILTRLVVPQVFGVMALVNLATIALHMFSDLGIAQCVIHHPRGDDPRFLNTAWTLQVGRGLILLLASALLAYPIALFYDVPALAWLIPLTGTTALLDGLISTSLLTLRRRLLLGGPVLLEIGSYLLAMTGVMLVIWWLAATHSGGAADPAVQQGQMAALAAGGIASGLIQVVVSYRLLRGHRHRFAYDPAAGRDLLHFGGWIFVSTACTFLASQADRMVIGKLSLEVLGVYQIGSQLAALPALLMTALSAQLVFPYYSRLFRNGDARAAVVRVHRTLAVAGGWMASGMIVASPSFVECLYPGRYHAAGQFAQILAVTGWFRMLQCAAESVLLAQGQTRLTALSQVVKLLALPGLLYFGYARGGLNGLIVGYTLAEALRYVVIAAAVARMGLPLIRDDLFLTLLLIGVSALVLGVGSLLWGGAAAPVRFVAETVTVTLIWAAVWLVVGRSRSTTQPPNHPST